MIDDEDATARLLRLAGARPLAPADRAVRVRQAVHDRWRATIRRRTVRRRATAAAAFIAAVVVAIAIGRMRGEPQPAAAGIVARVERVEGGLPFAAGDEVREGDSVETTATARVALRLPDGTSARLDVASRMRMLSETRLELARGAVYIDTGRALSGVEVRTPFGVARDIGTQFETRLTGAALQLRVRTGLVELRREGSDPVTARAGTELIVSRRETRSRPIAGDAPEWAWTSTLAPRFDIDGRSVAAFVEHVAREHGWSLRYADATVARDASSIVLHGSVAGLDANEALIAALATSSLQHEVRQGELLVSRRSNRGGR